MLHAHRLALVAPNVVALGHEVIAREIEVQDVGTVTARERPAVALVGLGAPKGTDLSVHSAIDLDWVATELNDRPRKRPRLRKADRRDRT